MRPHEVEASTPSLAREPGAVDDAFEGELSELSDSEPEKATEDDEGMSEGVEEDFEYGRVHHSCAIFTPLTVHRRATCQAPEDRRSQSWCYSRTSQSRFYQKEACTQDKVCGAFACSGSLEEYHDHASRRPVCGT